MAPMTRKHVNKEKKSAANKTSTTEPVIKKQQVS